MTANSALLAQVPVGSLSGRFTGLDWAVLLGYLALVSYLGVKLAGKQKSMEDFFRGGSKLPWYAVSASMIATIISAVTFIGVPSRIYAEGGDFSYLQFGIIAGLLSRLFVSLVLVPAYYRHHVYSPYDYMGERLGEAVRTVTTAMFSLMGLLAQAARVYLTAIILELVMRDQLQAIENATGVDSLVWSIAAVGAIAIVWTMLGGISTVVWTDAMLFLVFVIGGVVAIFVVANQLPGGLAQIVHEGWAAGKFKLWTLGQTEGTREFASRWGETFARPYTLWAAIFAVTFSNIGSYGTDQLLAQRIFTCKSKRDAQIAVMTSWAAEAVVALMLLVGVGLWTFYQHHPDLLVGDAANALSEKRDNIFPVFILTQVPVGLRGLIVAGIFAAAISSLTSILAALSQTSLSAVYLPLAGLSNESIPPERNQEILRASRLLVVVWGIALCTTAIGINAYVNYQEANERPIYFLDLALGLANYVLGTLFAAFLLAWLPLEKDAYGLIWSAPLSIACVFASRFHDDLTWRICGGVTAVLLITWIASALHPTRVARRGPLLAKTLWLMAGCALLFLLTKYLWFARLDQTTGAIRLDEKMPIEWPWYGPLGGSVAFVFGYLLGEPQADKASGQDHNG